MRPQDLELDGVMRRTAAEEHPQGRLLGEPKATRALLQSLVSTSVAIPRVHPQRMARKGPEEMTNGDWKH